MGIRRRRCGGVMALAILAAAAPATLPAQRTFDAARLVVGISAGWIGGVHLWDVGTQPIPRQFPGLYDTVALSRDVRENLTISGQMTYYRGQHFGWTAEFTYVGVGLNDHCTFAHPSSDDYNQEVCGALQNREEPASAVTLAGGFNYRPTGRTQFQPYFRATAGLTLMPRSTRAVVVNFYDPSGNLTEGDIYTDNSWTELRPTGTLGIGIATAPSQGYQLQVEFRETWMRVATVTGPTGPPYTGLDAPNRGTWLRLPSLMVGFDIVLEKSRGRRY